MLRFLHTHTEQRSAGTNVLGWKMQCSASAQSSRTLASTTQNITFTTKGVIHKNTKMRGKNGAGMSIQEVRVTILLMM